MAVAGDRNTFGKGSTAACRSLSPFCVVRPKPGGISIDSSHPGEAPAKR